VTGEFLRLLGLCAVLSLAACSTRERAPDGAGDADGGAAARDLARLFDGAAAPENPGDAAPVDVIGLGPRDAGPDADQHDAAVALDAGQLGDAGDAAALDAAQLGDAGSPHPCDPGRIDCDGVAANGCEMLAWDAGCAGLSTNGQRCAECAAGQLCACGSGVPSVPRCVTVCN
jgi:hypothetical protein